MTRTVEITRARGCNSLRSIPLYCFAVLGVLREVSTTVGVFTLDFGNSVSVFGRFLRCHSNHTADPRLAGGKQQVSLEF